MYASILLPLVAMTAGVVAAPTYPNLDMNSAMPGSIDTISDYFNMLAGKVKQGRTMSSAPICDLSNIVLPLTGASGSLPGPSPTLTIKHVALGRGTQNYTCDTTNATAAPVQIGAAATLFNATCLAATWPDLLNFLPRVALQFNLTGESNRPMAPTDLAQSGLHFFTNTTTPFFNLDFQPAMQLGTIGSAKNNSVTAPANAPRGQNNETAVPWLKLLARTGQASGNLQEVYRVETAGGSPPATCAGMPASFQVQYAAQYFFYQLPASS